MASALEWVKEHKWWLIACVLLAGAGYGVGRFALPTRERIVYQDRVEVKEVVRTVTEKGPVRYQKVVVEKPGAERVTTVTVQKDPVTIYRDREATGTTVSIQEKEIFRDAPRLTVGATVSLNPSLTVGYGAWVQYRLAGPFTVLAQGEGGAGTYSGRLGLGLTF